MNKFNYLILMLPMILNLMMILIMMIPSKINKFHPISLLIILIIMTFLISLKVNFLKKSMIPFILFLIMIGGLMVIYLYITSLANNELFNLNYKTWIMNISKTSPFMILLTLLMIWFYPIIFNYSIESFQFNNLLEMNYKIFNNMYMESNNKSSYFIMMYLYYSMICIMNICYKLKAPLRQLMFYE